MNQSIFGFPKELLIGAAFDEDGGRTTEFELLKTGGVTEQIRINDTLAQNRPIEWLGRMVASVVSRIGDHPIYNEFKKLEFREVPKALMKVPMADIDYLVTMGHMYTYGTRIDIPKPVKCPECGHKNKNVKVSLEKLSIEESKVEDIERFHAHLPDGFVKPKAKKKEEQLPVEGVVWNRYIFRPPLLEDALRRQGLFNKANMIEYNMAVASDCLLGVERWEADQADPDNEAKMVKVEELEQKYRHMWVKDLFSTLEGMDRNAIRAAFMKLPKIDLTAPYECRGCNEDINISVDFGNFFPLA